MFDLGGTILRLESADAFEGDHKLLELAANNTGITVDKDWYEFRDKIELL